MWRTVPGTVFKAAAFFLLRSRRRGGGHLFLAEPGDAEGEPVLAHRAVGFARVVDIARHLSALRKEPATAARIAAVEVAVYSFHRWIVILSVGCWDWGQTSRSSQIHRILPLLMEGSYMC